MDTSVGSPKIKLTVMGSAVEFFCYKRDLDIHTYFVSYNTSRCIVG